MRFINLFENFPDKFQKTNRFDTNSLRKLGLVPFDKKEVLEIYKALEKSKTCSGKLELNNSADNTELFIYCKEYNNRKRLRNLGSIYKSNDEWYYVYINWKFYKCDQLDGLLELLENEL